MRILAGLLKPCIFIPENSYDNDSLYLMIKHELVHSKRGDLYFKIITVFITCILWYNPLVHIINKFIDTECEMSCDDKVIKEEKKQVSIHYAKMLIELLEHSNGKRHYDSFSLSIKGGYKQMSKRIININDTSIRKNGRFTLFVTGIIIFSVFAINGVFTVHASENVSSLDIMEKSSINDKTNDASLNRSYVIPVIPVKTKSYEISKIFDHTIVFHAAIGTPVYASESGVVVEICNIKAPDFDINDYTSMGNYIIIENEFGEKYYYCNLDDLFVSVNDYIVSGEKIGSTGSTGNGLASGQCTFFVIDKNGSVMTPSVFKN